MTRAGTVPMRCLDIRGFTLLELIVVLVIIGVASALVVPRLVGGIGGLDIRTAAGKVAASLRYVGSRAISSKIEHTAVFDFGHNRLILASVNSGAVKEDGEAGENESAGSREKVYVLPEKVFFEKVAKEDNDLPGEALDAEFFRMTFYPSGGSDGGAVSLANERGKRYVVRVDRITGSVKVTRGDNR